MHEGTDVRPDEDMSVLLYNTNKQKDGIDPRQLREPKNSPNLRPVKFFGWNASKHCKDQIHIADPIKEF